MADKHGQKRLIICTVNKQHNLKGHYTKHSIADRIYAYPLSVLFCYYQLTDRLLNEIAKIILIPI